MVKDHAEAYPAAGDFRIDATLLRDQITSRARTVLLVLMAASGLVFIIACSNVANLILARTMRREGELAIRAALGASAAALRRTLLAESLLLCGAGATLGVLGAEPMVSVLARYASRFSVRALDLQVDSSMLWVGAALAVLAAVLLAFVPRLPSADSSHGFGLAGGSIRVTSSTNRRQRIFAVTQIAASFVLLAGAAMLVKTLVALQTAQTGLDMRSVLVINVPEMRYGKTDEQFAGLQKETVRRITALPGVDGVAIGSVAPYRDQYYLSLEFSADGHVHTAGQPDPRAQFRSVTPAFFATLGVPILAGRDFNESDRKDSEKVVIVSQALAERMFPGQDPLNRHVYWTDPVIKFIEMSGAPRRIVGVVADLDDEHVVPGPAATIYEPLEQGFGGDRLFVHVHGNPYALVTPITQTIRQLSAEQVVERAATLEDVRAEVLTPDRLNTIVFSGFAGVALLIAVVGVAGVLAFSVSGRTREFGIRLAIGSQPSSLVTGVIKQGVWMAGLGIVAGAALGYAVAILASKYFPDTKLPGALPVLGSAIVLLAAAVVASVLPAARAARVDVMQALRSE
jgi:predicted permease